VVKNRLKRIQYQPELIDAFLAHTGLKLDPTPHACHSKYAGGNYWSLPHSCQSIIST